MTGLSIGNNVYNRIIILRNRHEYCKLRHSDVIMSDLILIKKRYNLLVLKNRFSKIDDAHFQILNQINFYFSETGSINSELRIEELCIEEVDWSKEGF